ncbi:MAG: hypothetical protein HKN14_09015 [Marinicaulis sp.]|nr:hypothetical protein [Marinicaulis sp.]
MKLALFILRLTLTIFFALWAAEKFIKPETTVKIWDAFYLVGNLPLEASYAIGVIQSIVIVLFFFGILKFWTYGFLMVTHGLSTFSTYERIFDPFSGSNHLFLAAIPVLGALIALFMLRHEDTMLTLSSKIRALR